MRISDNLKAWANRIKRDGVTLWFAGKNPQTPWYAKALGVFVVAYALSPIDLIPDFIPIIGYLDDLLIVPLGLALVVRLTPPEVIQSSREQAARFAGKPISYGAALVILLLWLILAVWFVRWLIDIAGF